ncbi:MAG: hypothetical protein Q8Q09_12245 [Deltaproteobacteria bacterium]|nr:hypothetical protein [Deltaproteobacteria bacterium]
MSTRRDASTSDIQQGEDSAGASDAGVDSNTAVADVVRPSDGGCGGGRILCAGACVDVGSDIAHCGACGRACRPNPNSRAVCEAGSCTQLCLTGFADCDALATNGCEVNLGSNSAHCGRCGQACVFANSAPVCSGGACAAGTCLAGFGNCDGNAANGCETAINSSDHCGGCGVRCAGATPVCDVGRGMCSSGCGGADMRCGSSCVNTTTDTAHCGGCDRRCTVSNGVPGCAAGVCGVRSCAAGFADCDRVAANGCEANLQTDPVNCTACATRPPEVCNGRDDNCDGVVDEGFRGAASDVAYSALSALHAPCSAAGERVGPNCNAAISRFCAGQPCATTGFGPSENSPTSALAVCVAADVVVTTYTALRGFLSVCDGVTQRYGLACNAAIHRFCTNRGMTSGFGPIENSGDTAVVSCVRAGSSRVYESSYTEARGLHPGCDGSTVRMGGECNAAFHRFCTARGHVSGFGPIENDGDRLFLTCVDR